MPYYTTMTDRFMSGWGASKGKKNKFVVECETLADAEVVERAARQRPEMRWISVRWGARTPRFKNAHVSVRKFADLGACWKGGAP